MVFAHRTPSARPTAWSTSGSPSERSAAARRTKRSATAQRCVEIKFRGASLRHRRGACSMAWRFESCTYSIPSSRPRTPDSPVDFRTGAARRHEAHHQELRVELLREVRRREARARRRNSTYAIDAKSTHNNAGPPPRGPPPRGPPPPPQSGGGAPQVPGAPDLPKFGQLQVHVVRGSSLKAGQSMYGRADPYAKLTLGNQVFATNPCRPGVLNSTRPRRWRRGAETPSTRHER